MSTIERTSYLVAIALFLVATLMLHRANSKREAELAGSSGASAASSSTTGQGGTP